MLKVEKAEVWGFEHAIRGMRNPMNSWDRSDSSWIVNGSGQGEFRIGNNDLELMQKLYIAGSEHRKYLRQIFVSMDVIAPLYWFKEYDTYKVGTVANSCSTMHKIHSNEFTIDDFSCEHLIGNPKIPNFDGKYYSSYSVLRVIIDVLNDYREKYIATNDKKYWWQMIQLLPTSYNQKRTITMNYENVVSIIHQRSGHKLDEWNTFVSELKELPYIKDLLIMENK